MDGQLKRYSGPGPPMGGRPASRVSYDLEGEPVDDESIRIVDLRTVLTQMRLSRLLPSGVAICTDCPLLPCPVKMSPNRLRELIVDLVLNAREGVGGRGVIRIGVDRIEVRSPFGAGIDPWIRMEVSDTGGRIIPAVAARIFEPSFSELGRGLGLSEAHEIVKRHGGKIELTAEASGENTVRIELPAASTWHSVAQ